MARFKHAQKPRISTAIDGTPVEFDFSSGSCVVEDEKQIEALRAMCADHEDLEEVPEPPAKSGKPAPAQDASPLTEEV